MDEAADEHPLRSLGAEVHQLPVAAEAAVGAIAQHHRDLESLYLTLLADRSDVLVEAVRRIADAEGPILVHCAAGKDRTGMVIALVLAALGVDADAIVADYHRTEANMTGVLGRFALARDAEDKVAQLVLERPDLTLAPEGAMRTVLTHLEERHGGARRWLLDHGLSPASLDRLDLRLLEDG